MTKAQKLAEETELIREFIGDQTLFNHQYNNYNSLDRIVDFIQNLGYSFMLTSVKTEKGYNYIASFIDTKPPFINKSVNKCKTKLDAMYELVILFIQTYEPRKEEVN